MNRGHPQDPRLAAGTLRVTLDADCDAFDLPEKLWVRVSEWTGEAWTLRSSEGWIHTAELPLSLVVGLGEVVDDFRPLTLF